MKLIDAFDRESSAKLMGALDACNRRFGRGTVILASTGLERQRKRWDTRFAQRSPRYTTRVDEIPVVRAA